MSLFSSVVDRQFARFCRTGDTAALGTVFDRTAPELLRIACYLVGNRADAEDLVQRTFLAAIESRTAFTGGRALPWLLGILSNHARRLRRQRQRPPHAAIEPTADPVAIAAQRELETQLALLQKELGSPYAEVLRLHLEEGHNAKEIAARLLRPAGTVRTQLMRGMELLRRRLPDGFVAGGAFALVAGSTQASVIASIRAVVVPAAKAAAPAVAGPVVVLGGSLVSKKVALSLSLLLVLSMLGPWLLWPSANDAAPASDGSAVVQAAAVPAAPSVGKATEDAAATESERIVAATAAPASAPEPGFAIVRVVARWTDGRPAASVGVYASQGRPTTRRSAVTGSDGIAELLHLAPGSWSIGASLAAAAAADGSAGAPQRCQLHAGEVREVELLVRQTGLAKGRVVDAEQHPVAEARIWLSADGDANFGHEVARSAADGSFEVPITGTHYLGARKLGYSPSRVIAADPPACEHPFTLQLLHDGGVVRGFVRDERGDPVAWAKIRVGEDRMQLLNSQTQPRRENVPCGVEVTTNKDGSYEAVGVSSGIVAVHVGARGFSPQTVGVDVPAGGTAARDIVLQRAARVHGTVRDPQGHPVEGVTVELYAFGDFESATTQSLADGSYAIDDLGCGHVPLVARLGGAKARTTLKLAAGDDAVWDPVLGTDLGVRGRLLDDRGNGLADYEIAAWHDQDLRSRTTTAADGTFVLDQVGADMLVLEVSYGFDSLLKKPDIAPGSVDVALVLDDGHLPSATITGRLVDERGQPVATTIVPWHAESNRARHHQSDPKTGVYRIGPVRPGSYQLTIESPDFGRIQLGKHELVARQVLELGDFVLKAPGAAEIEVVQAGRPAAGGVVVFLRESGEWIDTTPIEHGVATHKALPTGRLLIYADYQGSVDYGSIEVVASSKATARLELQRPVRATITLRDPRGRTKDQLAPHLVARRGDGSHAGLFRTIGQIEQPTFFVDLPPAAYTLQVRVADGRTSDFAVDLRAGQCEHTIVLPQ